MARLNNQRVVNTVGILPIQLTTPHNIVETVSPYMAPLSVMALCKKYHLNKYSTGRRFAQGTAD